MEDAVVLEGEGGEQASEVEAVPVAAAAGRERPSRQYKGLKHKRKWGSSLTRSGPKTDRETIDANKAQNSQVPVNANAQQLRKAANATKQKPPTLLRQHK